MSPGKAPNSPRASGAELLMLAAVFVAANPWKEVGWRAFALSRLLARYPVPFAGLLVGVLAAL